MAVANETQTKQKKRIVPPQRTASQTQTGPMRRAVLCTRITNNGDPITPGIKTGYKQTGNVRFNLLRVFIGVRVRIMSSADAARNN